MKRYQMKCEHGRRFMAVLLSLVLIVSGTGSTAFAQGITDPNADLIIEEDAPAVTFEQTETVDEVGDAVTAEPGLFGSDEQTAYAAFGEAPADEVTVSAGDQNSSPMSLMWSAAGTARRSYRSQGRPTVRQSRQTAI